MYMQFYYKYHFGSKLLHIYIAPIIAQYGACTNAPSFCLSSCIVWGHVVYIGVLYGITYECVIGGHNLCICVR